MTSYTQAEGSDGFSPTVRQVACWAIAAASVASAVIHFSVIGEHFHDAWYFGVFFAVVAWAQIAWAIALVLRPTRRILFAGAALQALLVVVYVWSRTTGLPFGPTPWQPEAMAFVDVLSTVLEVAAGAGAVVVACTRLDRPITGRALVATLSALFLVMASSTSAALALAGTESQSMAGMNMDMSGSHMAKMGGPVTGSNMSTMGTTSSTDSMGSMTTSGSGGSSMSGMNGTGGSMSGSNGSMTGSTMAGMAGSTGTTMAAMGDMGSSSTTMPGMGTTMPGMGDGSFSLATTSPAGPIVWPAMAMDMEPGMAMAGPMCTTTPNAAQQAAAVNLVDQTVTATSRYRSLAAARADGFVPITPTGAAVVHYVNWHNLDEVSSPSEVLNPSAVQSLVYANTSTGPRLVAAMYIMPNGSTATPPDPGGCLDGWHIHTNLCFNSGNVVVAVTSPSGTCPAGSVNRVTQPMIHVWLAPVTGGPMMVDAPDPAVVAAASALPVGDAPPARA